MMRREQKELPDAFDTLSQQFQSEMKGQQT